MLEKYIHQIDRWVKYLFHCYTIFSCEHLRFVLVFVVVVNAPGQLLFLNTFKSVISLLGNILREISFVCVVYVCVYIHLHPFHYICSEALWEPFRTLLSIFLIKNLLNSCFDKPTIEEILQALRDDGSDWAMKQVEVWPLSLALNPLAPESD